MQEQDIIPPGEPLPVVLKLSEPFPLHYAVPVRKTGQPDRAPMAFFLLGMVVTLFMGGSAVYDWFAKTNTPLYQRGIYRTQSDPWAITFFIAMTIASIAGIIWKVRRPGLDKWLFVGAFSGLALASMVSGLCFLGS